MGRSGRIMFCNCIAYFSWKVYDLRRYAIANPSSLGGGNVDLFNFTATQNTPIAIPTQTDGTVAQECNAGQNGLARLQPPFGKLMSRINNRSPAVVNAFMQLNMDRAQPFDFDMLAWHGAEVRLTKGILELTIEPVTDLTRIPDSLYDEIARRVRDVNVNQGVPVLLRFGHEMNGDWVIAYGYKPIEYKNAFVKMATAIRQYTNLTAMVWAPNIGIQYPFNANIGEGSAPKPAPDDPYEPFYPGDEWVDWVGLSIYFYPASVTNDNIELPADDYFRQQMNIERPDYMVPVEFANNPAWVSMQQFYRLLPETGAPFVLQTGIVGADTVGRPADPEAWWQQVYNSQVIQTWPYLKLMVQFEEQKFQAGKILNFAVTNSTQADVLPAYNSYLDTVRDIIILGTDMAFACDGSIKLV
ncbi:glycoside hydrolase superfamily [Chytridium lagenaria]|nr:glycoside hydrolase superfamily [Chytridium lagenaria]